MEDKNTPEVKKMLRNIHIRELEIERDDWKKAFESLAVFCKEHLNNTDLFTVVEFIKRTRPTKNK